MIASLLGIDKNGISHTLLCKGLRMCPLSRVFVLTTLRVGFAATQSCIVKEFTQNPKDEVVSGCPRSESELDTHWRGELSYTHTETFIEVLWKKIVQKPECCGS